MRPGIEQALDPDASRLERLYIRLFGVPVNGLRIRLRRVLPATRGPYRAILDAGCGRGVFSMELAKQHPDATVTGIDLDPALVERANRIAGAARLANCRFECCDVVELPYEEAFDLVVSVDNLEHVEDDLGAIRRLRRALVKDGTLVVHVPGYYRRWPVFRRRVNFDVPGHVRPGYTREDLAGKLETAGFRVVSCEYTYGFLENLSNNISYAITGADQRNKAVYALAFPLLLAMSSTGAAAKPSWGAGVLAVAKRGELTS